MAHDAYDPGPDGTYPWFPRLPDGSPDWPRVVGGDAYRTEDGRWLTGTHSRPRRPSWHTGHAVLIDVTPRDPDGNAINPPTIAPLEAAATQ